MQLDITVDGDVHEIILHKIRGDELEVQYGDDGFSVEILELNAGDITFSLDGIKHQAYISFDENGLSWLSWQGGLYHMKRLDMLNMDEDFTNQAQGDGVSNLFSPMPGKVIKVNVKSGDQVKRGTVMLVVEAMKMENNITAEHAAVVEQVAVREGDMVDAGTQLVFLEVLDKE